MMVNLLTLLMAALVATSSVSPNPDENHIMTKPPDDRTINMVTDVMVRTLQYSKEVRNTNNEFLSEFHNRHV